VKLTEINDKTSLDVTEQMVVKEEYEGLSPETKRNPAICCSIQKQERPPLAKRVAQHLMGVIIRG